MIEDEKPQQDDNEPKKGDSDNTPNKLSLRERLKQTRDYALGNLALLGAEVSFVAADFKSHPWASLNDPIEAAEEYRADRFKADVRWDDLLKMRKEHGLKDISSSSREFWGRPNTESHDSQEAKSQGKDEDAEWETLLNSMQESGDPRELDVIKITSENRDPDLIAEFLAKNKDRLTPESIAFLEMSEKIKRRNPEEFTNKDPHDLQEYQGRNKNVGAVPMQFGALMPGLNQDKVNELASINSDFHEAYQTLKDQGVPREEFKQKLKAEKIQAELNGPQASRYATEDGRYRLEKQISAAVDRQFAYEDKMHPDEAIAYNAVYDKIEKLVDTYAGDLSEDDPKRIALRETISTIAKMPEDQWLGERDEDGYLKENGLMHKMDLFVDIQASRSSRFKGNSEGVASDKQDQTADSSETSTDSDGSESDNGSHKTNSKPAESKKSEASKDKISKFQKIKDAVSLRSTLARLKARRSRSPEAAKTKEKRSKLRKKIVGGVALVGAGVLAYAASKKWIEILDSLSDLNIGTDTDNNIPDSFNAKHGDNLWGISENLLKKSGINDPTDYQIDTVKDYLVEHNETYEPVGGDGAQDWINEGQDINLEGVETVINRVK